MTTKKTDSTKQSTPLPSFKKALPFILVITGIIGIVCSMFLIYDQIKIWENAHYQPACSLNPVISCGSVINSKQGDIFGIPGPFFGLLAFPVLITVGVALWAGARFKKWFWQGLELGALGGFLFALWLFFVSMYKVHALCPFCLTVDVSVYSAFWYITLYNLQEKYIALPHSWEKSINFLRRHHAEILVLWFIAVIALILKHFWYYYGNHI